MPGRPTHDDGAMASSSSSAMMSNEDAATAAQEEEARIAEALSLKLAISLQEEEDAALAAALAATDAATPAAGGRRIQTGSPGTARSGPIPGDRLNSAAHKQVTHLGRQTARKIQARYGIGPSTRDLLELVSGAKRSEVLAMIDEGQRSCVDAELVALRLDLLPRDD
mmetsp:Transcript_31798/g.61187  ORF Transcript_31798/g.61187 Transcript_31798/m.61187 type:complete len:167 (-) Transcript_31798:360-860(-)|eukprot:6191600-Pleurochrysis_carterae.AAC.3